MDLLPHQLDQVPASGLDLLQLGLASKARSLERNLLLTIILGKSQTKCNFNKIKEPLVAKKVFSSFVSQSPL